MLPEGWTESELRHSVRIHSGIAPGQVEVVSEGFVPYVKVEDLNNTDKTQFTSRTYVESDRFAIPKNSVIFPKRGAAIFSNKIRIAGVPMVLDTNLMAVECKADLDPEYLYYAIMHAGLHKLADTSPIPQLNNKHVLPYRLPRPTKSEQRKIAEVLNTWDEAIGKTEQLLANSRQQKHALMQQLLTGKQGANGGLQHRHLHEIASRIQRKSDGADHPVLMISSGTGFVRQDEKYSRFMAGKSLDDYILLKQGEFAYNKGNSKLYEFGCVFPLERYSQGLVPHVYVCFTLNNLCAPTFFKYLFEADYLHDQLGALVNTGVRNNGLLNIKPVDFMNVRVPLPPLEEQKSIAQILDVATDEIVQRARDSSLLKEQKRALMQQLLTGNRRVKIDEPAEEVITL